MYTYVLESLTSLSSYVNNGFCTLRRMLIVVASFIGLSILMLLVQYYLTRDGSVSEQYRTFRYSNVAVSMPGSDQNTSAEPCWMHETYETLQECVPCTEFETTAGIRPCKPSGYYDKINCTNGGVVYRSCQRVRWLEERNFIAFLITSSICAIAFTFLAQWRQKALDKKVMQKLQRQLGDSM